MENIVSKKIKSLEDDVNKLLNHFENETGIVFEEINFKPRNTIFTDKDREYLISDLKIFIQR